MFKRFGFISGMYVYHMHTWYLQRPEEGVDPLELKLPVGGSQPTGAGNQEGEESSLCVLSKSLLR